MPLDQYGRDLNYLRISVTDRCNFQCTYCMPEKVVYKDASALMSDEEILAFVEIFAGLGFYKIRVTGGEPTLRPHIVDLVRRIAQTDGVKMVTMTSNGVLLKDLARPLAEAGLKRVNISLDTLDPLQFCQVTRRGSLDAVWAGIEAAEVAGLAPIKINVVLLPGTPQAELCRLAGLTRSHAWQVRFIEAMPIGGSNDPANGLIYPTAPQVLQQIVACQGEVQLLDEGKLDGEAYLYRLKDAVGDIGFISSVSQPFCDTCSRMRLTPDGRLRLCLLHDDEVDLLTPMRRGMKPEDLRRLILESIWRKPKGHNLGSGEVPAARSMYQIGG